MNSTSTSVISNESPGFILKSLMDRWRISEAELCRQTKLPQTTINRLLVGHTTDPRANTLRPIANYFGVTIGQLLGDELLNYQKNTSDMPELDRIRIPVLGWDIVIPWVVEGMPLTYQNYDQWIFSERKLNEKAFAVSAPLILHSKFGKNSIIIVNTEPDYKDGDCIILQMGNTPCVRQVMRDGSRDLLKSLDPALPTEMMQPEHRFLGVIIEARVSC